MSVLAQDLFTSPLDEVRNTLLTYSTGSSTAPTVTPTTYKKPAYNWGNAVMPASVDISVSSCGSSQISANPTTPPKPKPTKPSNKFLGAVDEIEKALYEAQAAGNRYSHTDAKLQRIKKSIKLAAQERSYQFFRQSLGHGLFTAMVLDKKAGRKKRTPTNQVKKFMDSIKTELGDSVFDTFMGVHGDVTLMFAIDDTGSMSGEIQAAKDIATSIVNHQRNGAVDFILSPFNDPGTGPVVYRDPSQGGQFVRDINALRAHAGGDCPELTFTGILDAMNFGPLPGSPLYVFTDASAKDASNENFMDAVSFARAMGLTINFFTTGNLCGNPSFKSFEDLARETCGQMLRLPSSDDLKKLSTITGISLTGTTCLCSGGDNSASGKKKRSATKEYEIPLDDSIEKVIVTVTTQNTGPNIILKDPSGNTFSSGKVPFPQGALYEINNPMPGSWKLVISGAGKHTYLVKGSSKTNVDFDFFFVMIPSYGTNKKPIPISQPLLGETARVILIVTEADKLDAMSLDVDLLSKDGNSLGKASAKPVGTSGAHFSASFTPPLVPFRLVLKGKTKKGNKFERSSHSIVTPSNVLIRVLYAKEEYTVPAKGNGYVMFIVYNNGPSEVFDVNVKDTEKFKASLLRPTITVRKGRTSFFSVSFTAKSPATPGGTDAVLVTVTGKTSKVTAAHVVTLMVA
ncbi:hypothetical protein ACROYT_G033781 [Oculina patagonica]